jgi:peroxiredoxin Q/BCP
MKALISPVLLAAAVENAPRPQSGDPARPFSLPGSNGAKVQLSDYLGKKAVVLAFFPKAFTGG